jgi:hypothetical protein
MTFLGGIAHADKSRLSVDEIRGRLEVKGEIYILDPDGRRLDHMGSSVSTWRGAGRSPLESNWSATSGDFSDVFLHHAWTVLPDGSISVVIEEYAKKEDDPKTGKFQKFANLIKKSEFVLENFAPVTWKVLNNDKQYVVVRLTPTLRDTGGSKIVADLPVAGRNVFVMDNRGYLWNDGDGSSFDGNFVGLMTHRGTIIISYKPFKGAKVVGEAWGKEIVLKFTDDLKVKLRSDTAFLPDRVGSDVYGLYLPDQKTDHPHSTHISTSSNEDSILKMIRQ